MSEDGIELLPGIFATRDQREALERLTRFLDSGDRTFTLVGRGGTGKTTVVRALVDRALEMNLRVGGGAVSHAAKEVLGESIGDARVHTVAALLAIKLNESTGAFEPDEWARSRGLLPIRDLDLVIIDEASMISADMLDAMLELADASAQFVFMGDNVQLPPIGDGEEDSPAFTVSSARAQAVLVERVRQSSESPIVPLSDRIADNIEGEARLRALDERDRTNQFDLKSGQGVLFVASEADTVAMLVEDLRQDGGDPRGSKAIVFNNERYTRSSQSVLNLNRTVREHLYGARSMNQFNVGEVVVAYAAWSPGRKHAPIIHNAVSYVVESVSAPYQKPVRFRWMDQRFSETYRAVDVRLKDHKGRAATVPVVEAADLRRFQADLSNPQKVRGALYFRLSEAFANLQYGYAITTHKAQGSTYRNVYVFEDNILGDTNGSSPVTKNKSLYVAVTRASHKLVIHSRLNPASAPASRTLDSGLEAPKAANAPPSPAQQALLRQLRDQGLLKLGSEL